MILSGTIPAPPGAWPNTDRSAQAIEALLEIRFPLPPPSPSMPPWVPVTVPNPVLILCCPCALVLRGWYATLRRFKISRETIRLVILNTSNTEKVKRSVHYKKRFTWTYSVLKLAFITFKSSYYGNQWYNDKSVCFTNAYRQRLFQITPPSAICLEAP